VEVPWLRPCREWFIASWSKEQNDKNRMTRFLPSKFEESVPREESSHKKNKVMTEKKRSKETNDVGIRK
jgi:hypothetical protein